MANAIGKFKKYIPLLEEVYVLESKTAVLDSSNVGVEQGRNANEIVIPKMTMDGLSDYDRNGGYVKGSVGITYQTVPFNYDRGKQFEVDNMDDEETAGIAFGQLSSAFLRRKVVPEGDAFRFATYAGVSGIGMATPAGLTTGDDVLQAIRVARSEMDEAEVPESDRHLFITPTNLNLVEALDTDKSREVLMSFETITKVPQKRFYSGIDLGTDGFTKSAGALNINFFVIHKPALMQFVKHNVNKAFTPDENQDADGWKFNFRNYALASVYDEMVAGLYLHTDVV
jgi:hypothetical protein